MINVLGAFILKYPLLNMVLYMTSNRFKLHRCVNTFSRSTYCLYGSSKARKRIFLCSSLRNLSCCSSDWSKLETGNRNGNHMNVNHSVNVGSVEIKLDLMKMRASSLGYSI